MLFLAFRLNIEKLPNQRGNSVQNLSRVNVKTKKPKQLDLEDLKNDLKTRIPGTTQTNTVPTTVTQGKLETKSLLDQKGIIPSNKRQA
jgi:hypothetical protein